jgi:site-specific recombinase XerD
MNPDDLINHDRMLAGAIDSFMGHTVHMRPFLASDYREALEGMAERWLDEGRPNTLAAVDSAWLEAYLASVEEPDLVRRAINELYQWAIDQNLVAENPVA